MNTVNPIRNNIAFTVFVSYKPPLLMCILKPIKAATRINTETANSQTDHFFIFNEPYAATRYKILLMKFAPPPPRVRVVLRHLTGGAKQPLA